ncbi:hypothetical protein DL770_009768 [Monosporascus sp. CRB-9-2]|nr:hypothetical protein DL770_009768 [Monosporascus sp. CRB-9-2]
MATESTGRETTTVPPPGMNRPLWPIDDRAKTAIRELQEGELLQLMVDYSEDEVQFVNSYKQVKPDSVAEYFASPSPEIFSFYHYPGSDAVVLIWTRHHWTKSTKHTKLQNGLRRDLVLIAEGEGIKAAHMLRHGGTGGGRNRGGAGRPFFDVETIGPDGKVQHQGPGHGATARGRRKRNEEEICNANDIDLRRNRTTKRKQEEQQQQRWKGDASEGTGTAGRSSQPSNIRTLSTGNTTLTDTLYCTIDTSRVEADEGDRVTPAAIRTMLETEIRTEQEPPNWRYQAVTRDPKNAHRIRVASRDEDEQQMVKQTAGSKLARRARVLRDELYRIRVDGIRRTAVVDKLGVPLDGVNQALGEENDTEVAKIGWLSGRDNPKAYGSMVVYLTKASEARRFFTTDISMPVGSREGQRFAEDVLREATTTAPAPRSLRSAFRAAASTSHSAKVVGSSTLLSMSKALRIIQLNVRKRGEVHDSLINDKEVEHAAVVAIQEPQARRVKGRLLTTPMGHHKWTKMVPSTWERGQMGDQKHALDKERRRS